jgi:hypothetical protein
VRCAPDASQSIARGRVFVQGSTIVWKLAFWEPTFQHDGVTVSGRCPCKCSCSASTPVALSFRSLLYYDVSRNQFSGSIPSELGALTTLL